MSMEAGASSAVRAGSGQEHAGLPCIVGGPWEGANMGSSCETKWAVWDSWEVQGGQLYREA
jgi:hypothetical protein